MHHEHSIDLIAAAVLLGVGTYGFTLHGSGVVSYAGDSYCAPLQDHKRAWFVMASIDTAVTFILPFTIIGVLNTCTATKLWLIAYKAKRRDFVNNVDNNAFTVDDCSDCSANNGAAQGLKLVTLKRLCGSEQDNKRTARTPVPAVAEALLNRNGATGVAVIEKTDVYKKREDDTGRPTVVVKPLTRLSLTKNSSSEQQRNRLSQRVSLYEMLTKNRRSIHMRATRTLLFISTYRHTITKTYPMLYYPVYRRFVVCDDHNKV